MRDFLADKYTGCLLGLAIGDALGAPVEFKPRGTFPPVTDYQAGGPFLLPAGYWTDDTSLALCLADSLLREQGFSEEQCMDLFLKWYRSGYRSSTGSCFDIGNTTRQAVVAFEFNRNPIAGPTDPDTAGNGSIMRLGPLVLAYAFTRQLQSKAEDSSRITHGAHESVEACRILAIILERALTTKCKKDILKPVFSLSQSEGIQVIAQGDYRYKTADEIRGSGYVVESLEAALWSFANTSSFAECVLTAINLGEDTDTTGAVAGQIAGAFYGEKEISLHWRNNLFEGTQIRNLAFELLALNERGPR